jgi:hypothetical protein
MRSKGHLLHFAQESIQRPRYVRISPYPRPTVATTGRVLADNRYLHLY